MVLSWVSSLPEDHPRLRGEHDLHSTWPESAEGSSPLARGALRVKEAA